MRSFFLQRVLTSANVNFLKLPQREMDLILPFLISVCFSNPIADLYGTLFENYNKVVYSLIGKNKPSIQYIPALNDDGMLSPIDISIDVDWISKVETSESQTSVYTNI